VKVRALNHRSLTVPDVEVIVSFRSNALFVSRHFSQRTLPQSKQMLIAGETWSYFRLVGRNKLKGKCEQKEELFGNLRSPKDSK